MWFLPIRVYKYRRGAFLPVKSLLVVVTLLIAIVASIGPAIQAYRVDPLQLFRS